MDFVDSCPCCGESRLVAIRTYDFARPATPLREIGSDPVKERLAILFDRMLGGESTARFTLHSCPACGFCFTNPRMSEADIRAKYGAIAELGTTRERYRKKPPTRLDERARRIRKLLLGSGFSPDSGKKILDVGGAWGYCILPFVGQCRLHLVDYEKWDLDPGIEYLGQSVSDIPEAERFDCILFLHTLEHVPDPRKAVGDLARRLTDDGFLYIEVPLGVFWEMTRLQEPITHVNFFGEESLFNLARALGLHVTSLSTDFQWVTGSRQWCVNMVVSKKERPSDTRVARPTSRQRYGWRYFALAVLNRMARKLGVDT